MKMQKIRDFWDTDHDSAQDRTTNQSTISLIGAPDDRGVRNVGGRLGAAHGPAALRTIFENMLVGTGDELLPIRKGFDIPIQNTIEATHDCLRDAVAKCLSENNLPIAIGGGHDLGFPHFSGVASAVKRKLALINVDAHFDVRPPNEQGITSGSPFFLAIESGVLDPKLFYEFGIQEHCNTREAAKYLLEKKAHIYTLRELRLSKKDPVTTFKKLILDLDKKNVDVVVSFDLDAVSMAWAPGVSAPQIDGFTAFEFLEMSRFCGRQKNVRSIGYFELAPMLDENGKTARLAATAVHRFASGFASRFSSKRLGEEKTPLRRLLRAPGGRRGL